MTVTTPPRPQTPPPSRRRDPVEHVDPEALIEEARQRARRRRRAYAAAAAALALVGVSLAVIFGRPESSQSAATGPPAPPIAADDDDAATLVARHAGFSGFVFVYADGRVISSGPQPGIRCFWPWMPCLAGDGLPIVRRLNATGLDAVRSGDVKPRALLREENPNSLLAGLWADAEPRNWEPPKYAVCPDGPRALDLEQLPAPAQALLRGKELTTYPSSMDLPSECFGVSRAEATLFRLALLDAGLPIPLGDYPGIWRNYPTGYYPLETVGGGVVPGAGSAPPNAMHVLPVLPHGEVFER